MTSGLASRMAHTDPRLLLPPGVTSLPGRLELIAALPLPGAAHGLFLAVARDSSGPVHVVPIVDDATVLRRARAADGVADAVVQLLAQGSPLADFEPRAASAVSPVSGPWKAHEDEDREDYLSTTAHVGLLRTPAVWDGAVPDPLGALARAGYAGMAPWLGDIVFSPAGPSAELAVGPIAVAGGRLPGARPVTEIFLERVAAHLRGDSDPEPTIDLAAGIGARLAATHVALAQLPGQPGPLVAEPDIQRWRRSATDAFAEAVVLAEGEPGERLRARRSEFRQAIAGLDVAVGHAFLPALRVTGLRSLLVEGGSVLLDPMHVPANGIPWRLPVRDVVAVLRGTDHLARTVHRRLVTSGFPAPVERVASWIGGVREALVSAYVTELERQGRSGWFDDRLVRAFQVEAECRALSRASRYLSTSAGISDAALADLLG